MKRAITLLMIVLIIILSILAINNSKGEISEVYDKNYYYIKFTQWSDRHKHELRLNENDELQVDIECESGSVALDIRCKNGAGAYTGNDLKTCTFTVKVSEAGEYVIAIKGENASGSVDIKNLLGNVG